MQIPDVNVLVSAYRADAEHHLLSRTWLETALDADEPLGLSELVLNGVQRVLTHRRVFTPPNTAEEANQFVEYLMALPNVIALRPGAGHWRIFIALCRSSNAIGNRIPDAYHAALAIEHGCEWITLDGGFANYSGLSWKNLRR